MAEETSKERPEDGAVSVPPAAKQDATAAQAAPAPKKRTTFRSMFSSLRAAVSHAAPASREAEPVTEKAAAPPNAEENAPASDAAPSPAMNSAAASAPTSVPPSTPASKTGSKASSPDNKTDTKRSALQRLQAATAHAAEAMVNTGRQVARTSSSSIAAASVSKDTFPDCPMDINPSTGLNWVTYMADNWVVLRTQAAQSAGLARAVTDPMERLSAKTSTKRTKAQEVHDSLSKLSQMHENVELCASKLVSIAAGLDQLNDVLGRLQELSIERNVIVQRTSLYRTLTAHTAQRLSDVNRAKVQLKQEHDRHVLVSQSMQSDPALFEMAMRHQLEKLRQHRSLGSTKSSEHEPLRMAQIELVDAEGQERLDEFLADVSEPVSPVKSMSHEGLESNTLVNAQDEEPSSTPELDKSNEKSQ